MIQNNNKNNFQTIYLLRKKCQILKLTTLQCIITLERFFETTRSPNTVKY